MEKTSEKTSTWLALRNPVFRRLWLAVGFRKLQAVSSTPIKKLPASSRISQPGIPVADRGGEEVNVGSVISGPAEAISAGSQALAEVRVTIENSVFGIGSILNERENAFVVTLLIIWSNVLAGNRSHMDV